MIIRVESSGDSDHLNHELVKERSRGFNCHVFLEKVTDKCVLGRVKVPHLHPPQVWFAEDAEAVGVMV